MGLAEKRVAAALEKESFPKWKDLVNQSCKLELQYEVKWDELVKEGFAESYPNNVEWNFFTPLAQSLASICADDLGLNAFKDKIKKIKITSTRGWSSLEVKIEGDTLWLDADPSYERTEGSVADYTTRITSALEAAL
jgi:hypothetical protein